MCIIQYDCLIVLYIFIPLVRIASFLLIIIIINSCVRKELTDLLSFHKTQLQQITVEEHLFGEFALATLTFGPCTSTSDTFPFAYHFPPVPISISEPFNCSPIFTVRLPVILPFLLSIFATPRQNLSSCSYLKVAFFG